MVYLEKQSTKMIRNSWRRSGGRAHNVNGEGIPWSLRLNGARRLLAVAAIGAQLALRAALGGLQTDAVTCFMGVVVTEEFPQSMAAKVGGSV